MSKAEDLLAYQIKVCGLPRPEREYRFATPRRWRFDFAWQDRMLAVEVDGGIWTGGRHVRGSGYERDCAKFNAATIACWRVLHFTPSQIKSGLAIQILESVIKEMNPSGFCQLCKRPFYVPHMDHYKVAGRCVNS